MADGGEPAVMLQRLVLTWGHAKCLALMLRDLVPMHEKISDPSPSTMPAVSQPVFATDIGTILPSPEKRLLPVPRLLRLRHLGLTPRWHFLQ
jgi:hypothetical protein